LDDIQKRPVLLRWIAQHPKAPAHLRAKLLPRLPWRVLASIVWDASAHPQARTQATERLQAQWGILSLGERRSLASVAPRPIWKLVWRVRDSNTIAALLRHRWLTGEQLVALIQAPIQPAHLEALLASEWNRHEGVIAQVLQALDISLREPESPVVLGHAAPWVIALPSDQCLAVANTLRHAPLRRLVRAQAPEAIPDSF
jgi:lambda repressor-like predicted transcriptional regulator